MSHGSQRRQRRSLRLKGFDYSQKGPYFITLCTQNRECLFGEIADGEMRLNEAGHMVEKWWTELNNKFQSIETDQWIVMPNHFHGIILIVGAGLALPVEGAALAGQARGAPTGLSGAASSAPTGYGTARLGDVVRAFKSITAIKVNRILGRSGRPLWQRNYYEHVIRDDASLNRMREYIETNPRRWDLDRENPDRRGVDDFDRWLSEFKTRPGERSRV